MGYENEAVTVLPFTARTATPTTADQMNRNNSGLAVIVSVITAPGGGASLLPVVSGVDRLTETYNAVDPTANTTRPTALTYPYTWNILTADPPISTPGLYVYRIYPTAIAPVSGLVHNDFVPRFFNIGITHSDSTSSWLYAVSYQSIET